MQQMTGFISGAFDREPSDKDKRAALNIAKASGAFRFSPSGYLVTKRKANAKKAKELLREGIRKRYSASGFRDIPGGVQCKWAYDDLIDGSCIYHRGCEVINTAGFSHIAEMDADIKGFEKWLVRAGLDLIIPDEEVFIRTTERIRKKYYKRYRSTLVFCRR